jgi:HK97 family phage major capsid protein
MDNIKELQTRKNGLLLEMQNIATKGFTSESRARFDRINADVEAIEGDIARAQSLANYEAESREFVRVPRGPVGSGTGELVGERRERLNKAFRSFFRTGGKIEPEYRDLLTTSDVTGGALIPQEFFGELINMTKFYGPIAQKVKQKVTDGTGRPMKISLGNDTGNGLVLLGTEGSSAPAETDPAFESKILGVDTVSGGLVKISVEEMADSAFNLDTAIRDYFGIRYARGLETIVTTGKDSAGNVLPNSTAGGLLGATPVGATTATVAAGIGWDDLVNLQAALDPSYAINPSWVMSSNTRSYLLGLRDGFGRPYFTPDPSGDSPLSKLLGWPIVINQAMPAIAASTTPILFGDLEKAYLLRTDGNPSIIHLQERFMDVLEHGFLMFSRIGSTSLAYNAEPVLALKIAAS